MSSTASFTSPRPNLKSKSPPKNSLISPPEFSAGDPANAQGRVLVS
jgi:hypothetical protein